MINLDPVWIGRDGELCGDPTGVSDESLELLLSAHEAHFAKYPDLLKMTIGPSGVVHFLYAEAVE